MEIMPYLTSLGLRAMLTKRGLKEIAKRALFEVRRAPLHAGVIILPNHYYIGVSDINALRRTTDTWARRSKLLGVDSDLDGRVICIRDVCAPFEPEYRSNPFLQGRCLARQRAGVRLYRSPGPIRGRQALQTTADYRGGLRYIHPMHLGRHCYERGRRSTAMRHHMHRTAP